MNEKTEGPTYHYRLFHYQNGLGTDVWKAARLPKILFYHWVGTFTGTFMDGYYEYKFDSRHEAEKAIRQDAEERRAKNKDRLKKQLNLIISEDITA